MATGSDTDWAAFTGVIGDARLALQTQDFVSARSKVAEAMAIALALGSSVGANGSFFQVAIESCNSLADLIEKVQISTAQSLTRGRLIRTGLRDTGRGRNHGGGGILHD